MVPAAQVSEAEELGVGEGPLCVGGVGEGKVEIEVESVGVKKVEVVRG